MSVYEVVEKVLAEQPTMRKFHARHVYDLACVELGEPVDELFWAVMSACHRTCSWAGGGHFVRLA